MSILPHQEILALCSMAPGDPDDRWTSIGPIRPCLKGNVRSAGYDLRLGTEYYLQEKSRHGRLDIRSLDPARGRTLIIPKNQVLIVTTVEKLCLPNDIAGHLSLKLDLLLKGLIMASQSQIDAGYEGHIFALLYNLTKEEVSLQLEESILRLELVRLSAPTVKPYADKYKNIPLSRALRSPVESSLHSIQRDVDTYNKKLLWTQIGGGVLLVAASIVTSIFTYFGPLNNRVTKVEQQVADVEKLHSLESSLASKVGKNELEALREEIKDMKAKLSGITEPKSKERSTPERKHAPSER